MNKQRNVTLSTVIIAAGIALVRQLLGATGLFHSIWAEDGWIQLCVVAKGHGSCLGNQVNGYWPVIHRLIAEPLAMLPLNWWPVVSPVIAAAFLGMFAAVVFRVLRDSAGITSALIGFAAVVLAPSLGMEFINVLGNIHWIILMVALVWLVNFSRNDRVTRSTTALMFLAGLANPAGFVLIFLVFLLWLIGSFGLRTALRLGGAAFAGWVIQVFAIVVFGGTKRVGTSFTFEEKMINVINSFIGVIPGLRVDSTQSVSFLATSTRLTSVTLLLALVFFLAVRVLDSKSGVETRAFAALGLTTQALSLFLMLILDPNPRYLYVIIALNSVWVVGMIGLRARRTAVLALTFLAYLALVVPGLAAGPYRTTPSDTPWGEQIRMARQGCSAGAEDAELFFAPERSYETKVDCSRL